MEDQTKSGQLPLASAAMVELKAELSRKKEEFRREKTSNVNNVFQGKKLQKVSLKKKTDVWDRKNAGVSARAQKDIEQTELGEDEDALMKSKLILERKSKIYDAISTSGDIPGDDGSEGYLVDFQKKVVDALVEQRELRRREVEEEEEEAERKALSEPIPEAENSDDEWVDYTDSLGRSRRCMRKDLKDLHKKDQDLAVSMNQKKFLQREQSGGRDGDDTESPHLMSDDMYREKMRQKWEEEARQLVEKGQEEIHYANVQHDEIRTHGVGFYQFSKDQEEREAQLEKLNKLRDETRTARSRTEMVKDKRKALMEARLAKVRERRKLKTKDTPSADEDTGSNLRQADTEEKKKAEEMRRVKEEAEKAAEEARKKFIREWDKKKVASSWKGDGYVESRRQERDAEFAPPSTYFKDVNRSSKTAHPKYDFCDNKFAHNSNRTYPQMYVSDKNKTGADDESFKEFSSNVDIFQSTEANSVTPPTKVSLSRALPVTSIPLPSDKKTASLGSGLSSGMSNFHQSFNEAVQQHSDYCYSNCQPQHHDESASNNQNHGLSSSQGFTENIGTTIHQQMPWAQQQEHQQVSWAHQQQCQQVSWPQQHQQHQQLGHQYFPHQRTHSPVGEPVAYQYPHHSEALSLTHANPNQGGAPICHGLTRIPDDATGVKRSSRNATETSTSIAPKKLKVPKSAILDNRFVLNSEVTQLCGITTETDGPLTVQAIPYKPGSFTDAKFKHEAPPSEEESTPSSRGKAQISGGPMMYTKEQRQQQLLQMKENEESGNEEVDEKVDEFLKSVRDEMT